MDFLLLRCDGHRYVAQYILVCKNEGEEQRFSSLNNLTISKVFDSSEGDNRALR